MNTHWHGDVVVWFPHANVVHMGVTPEAFTKVVWTELSAAKN